MENDNTTKDYDLYLLESMLGTPVSRNAGLQIAVDKNLPLQFPKNIHYELYKHHVELHVESSTHDSLCIFLKNHLPNNEIAKSEHRGFCKYAYMLNKWVEGWHNIKELSEAIIELRDIVEPVLQLYCEQVVEDFELTKSLAQYYEEQEATLPFHINVIDALHANENAHTRILTHLLKYKEEGKYLILSSFLKRIQTFNAESFDIENSKVYFNKDNIDGLIEKECEYAIIIENKIHWADDQDKQIERYVTTEIEKGIPADNIWVIYLTRDGRKKVEDYSLTEKTRDLLKDRFVEMDYRHDILPWLKDDILPNCRLKEDLLASAIKQYIDHLEGLLGMRDTRKDFREKVQNKIANSIGCTKEMSKGEAYLKLHSYMHTLGGLQNVVQSSIENLTNPVVRHLQSATIEVLSELCPNERISFYNGIHGGFYQLFFEKWNNHKVHFEWIPLNEKRLLSGKEYTFVLHVEQNEIKNDLDNVLKNSGMDDKANAVGLKMHKRDNRVFYKKVISTNRSMADMTHEEFISFLHEAYKDVNTIQQFVTNHVFNK